MQSIILSHGPVYYRQAGQGLPLLLIHGWGGSSRYWQKTIEHFAPTRNVYALDLPGYGQSPPLPDKSSAERLAACIIEYADAVQMKQFDLIAHSFGAGIAAFVAARWPERVRCLVLTCFSTFRNEFERRMIEHMLNQMGLSVALWQPWMALWHPWLALWQSWTTMWKPHPSGNVPTIYQTLAWRFFYRIPTDEDLLREGFEDFLRMDQRTSLESIVSALNPRVSIAMQNITAPTLLIGACQDMIMPSSGVPVVAQLIPNCQLEWIEYCGHVPMIEKPDEYHRIVQTFLLDTIA